VGVALDHGQTARDAAVRLRGIEFEAADLGVALAHQQRHQRSVAAADIEHARIVLDQARGGAMIAAPLVAELERGGMDEFELRHQSAPPCMPRPRAAAAASIKPVSADSNAGSSAM